MRVLRDLWRDSPAAVFVTTVLLTLVLVAAARAYSHPQPVRPADAPPPAHCTYLVC